MEGGELITLCSQCSVAADIQINHLTVMKSYQLLVTKGFVEKRLGQGMFVAPGAKQNILETEKAHFLAEQVPLIADTLTRLDIPITELNQHLNVYIEGDQ